MSQVAGQRVGVADVDATIAERFREQVARHWKLFLVIGVLCLAAGVFSILMPIVTSVAVTIIVGWALVVAGGVQLAHIFRADGGWEVAWRLLVGVLTVIAGLWLLLAPLTGTITLTVVLVAWFWAVGVTRLVGWWQSRGVEGSWWLAVSGLLSIVMGALIWADLPSSAAWAIGLLVGIDLIFAAVDLIAAALAGRRLADDRGAGRDLAGAH
jgi:uncharacterized membrane protein HdeD (DUF308 family)